MMYNDGVQFVYAAMSLYIVWTTLRCMTVMPPNILIREKITYLNVMGELNIGLHCALYTNEGYIGQIYIIICCWADLEMS